MGLAHRTPCPVGASRRLASRSSTGLMAPASLAAIASSASRARSQVGAPRELPGGRPGRALRRAPRASSQVGVPGELPGRPARAPRWASRASSQVRVGRPCGLQRDGGRPGVVRWRRAGKPTDTKHVQSELQLWTRLYFSISRWVT